MKNKLTFYKRRRQILLYLQKNNKMLQLIIRRMRIKQQNVFWIAGYRMNQYKNRKHTSQKFKRNSNIINIIFLFLMMQAFIIITLFLHQSALKIQIAFRRYKFQQYQKRISRRTLKICSSQDQLNFNSYQQIIKPQQSCLARARSEFFTNRDGNTTPTLSERKKSVSFCDPLEEVYYVESFKTDRSKTADKQKRRFRFERQYITPLLNQSLNDFKLKDLQNSNLSPNKPCQFEQRNSMSSSQIKPYFTTNDQCINIESPQKIIKNLNDQLGNELPVIHEIEVVCPNRSLIQSNSVTSNNHLQKLQKKYVNNNQQNVNRTPINTHLQKLETKNQQNLGSTMKTSENRSFIGDKSPTQRNIQNLERTPPPLPSYKNTFLKAYKEKTQLTPQIETSQSVKTLQKSLTTVIDKKSPDTCQERKFSYLKSNSKKVSPKNSVDKTSPINLIGQTKVQKRVSPRPQFSNQTSPKENSEQNKSQIKDTKSSFLKKNHTNQLLQNKQQLQKQQQMPIQKQQNNNTIAFKQYNTKKEIPSPNNSEIMETNVFKKYLENKYIQTKNSKITSSFVLNHKQSRQSPKLNLSRNSPLGESSTLQNESNCNISEQVDQQKGMVRYSSLQKLNLSQNNQPMFLSVLRPDSRNSLAGSKEKEQRRKKYVMVPLVKQNEQSLEEINETRIKQCGRTNFSKNHDSLFKICTT